MHVLLYTVYVRARVIKPRVYGVHVLGMECRKELARLRKQRQRQKKLASFQVKTRGRAHFCW